ncbi:MAG: TlpA family protein disulfide reductase [Acidobacteriota bacterium]|nr:TlpA family protein disulfide reductase [Acidobacteriota bacterium]
MQTNKSLDSWQRLFTPVRVAFTVVVLSLFAAFGVSSCNSTDERKPERGANTATAPAAKTAPAPPAVLTTLPPNVLNAEMKAVNGASIKLSNYSGKVLVVNLWATWCGPCRLEIPELVKLYTEFRGQGLEVVGLSTENPEASAEGVKRFVQDYDINYRVGWANADVALTLMQGRDAIPQSFVIGRDGRVVKRFVGFSQTSTPLLMKEAIQEALNGKAAAD